MTDALWFGFVTLALPVILDRSAVRYRWWMKYRFEPRYAPMIARVETAVRIYEESKIASIVRARITGERE